MDSSYRYFTPEPKIKKIMIWKSVYVWIIGNIPKIKENKKAAVEYYITGSDQDISTSAAIITISRRVSAVAVAEADGSFKRLSGAGDKA